MSRVLTIVGTRPEAIKMAPVVAALKEAEMCGRVEKSYFGFTGQHPLGMVSPILKAFGLHFTFGLLLDRTDGSLACLTSQLMQGLHAHISIIKPDFVFVHGDTTTALCGSLVAFYHQIPIGHVEAGLRTARFESPFPEEMNRRLITRMASLHFAPTVKAARNLYDEGVDPHSVFVTGNTVVDSLNRVFNTTNPGAYNVFPMLPYTREVIVVTCHRRESWGKPLEDLCRTIKHLAFDHPNYMFVWPVHPNPAVKEVVEKHLRGIRNVRLYGPIDYTDFVWLLKVAQLIITDSGGVLEEASVLGVPTLVLRQETERPEALDLHGVELVGYDFDILRRKVISFIDHPPATESSASFGCGDAGELIVDILLKNIDGVQHANKRKR